MRIYRNGYTALYTAVGMGLLLAGCETPKQSVRYKPTAEPYCAAVQTVCISKDDQLTEGTAQGIEANNLGRKSLIKQKQCKPRASDECAPKKPTS